MAAFIGVPDRFRVRAVFLGSAGISILAFLQICRISNLRLLNTRSEFEPSPVQHGADVFFKGPRREVIQEPPKSPFLWRWKYAGQRYRLAMRFRKQMRGPPHGLPMNRWSVVLRRCRTLAGWVGRHQTKVSVRAGEHLNQPFFIVLRNGGYPDAVNVYQVLPRKRPRRAMRAS